MYIVTSLSSNKGNNTGSSSKYLKYISKDTNGVVFDSMGQEVDVETAIERIDQNSKGGIRKNEARWYSPVYSFSQEESLHVANEILQHGDLKSRNIKCLDDLNATEKKKYNARITSLALEFQNEMAKNFNREDIGIKTKDHILWYGTVENKRYYTGYDDDVKKGEAKEGDEKLGFNTHVHIIQSRKGLNEKKSLLSPQANARKRTKQGAGFDRNIFYNKVEQAFDKQTGYKRDFENTFEYYKFQTKKKAYWKTKGFFKDYASVENRFPNYPKNYQNKVDKSIVKNSKCVNYFFLLEQRGLVSFEKKIGDNYYFKKHNQKTGSIAVSQKGWKDFSTDDGGGILKAIHIWDQFNWNQCISLIKTLDDHYYEQREQKIKREIELVQNLKHERLINYIEKRGITLDTAKRYLKEVHYKSSDKHQTNYSIGFENNSGGYALRSKDYKSNIGKQDISTINFKKGNSNSVLVFEGFFDYISYIQIKGEPYQKVIVMNSTSNFNKLFDFAKSNPGYTFEYYGDNDKAGDLLLEKINNRGIKIIDKRDLYEGYKDLNDYITQHKTIKEIQFEDSPKSKPQEEQNNVRKPKL